MLKSLVLSVSSLSKSLSPQSSYSEIAKSCNMFRNYKDLTDAWYRVTDVIDYYGDDVGNFSAVSGPGAWNDPGLVSFPE